MVLLSALVLGLTAGWGLARWKRRTYRSPNLTSLWLVPAALIPQLLVTDLAATRNWLPGWLATVALPATLLIFLAFIWINRKQPGMGLVLVGAVLNLLVIASNGGWMPISPETASRLPGAFGSPGERFGKKDILLLPRDTHFAFLADRFLLPDWAHYQVAFSLGDILIAAGVFWLLASGGLGPKPQRSET